MIYFLKILMYSIYFLNIYILVLNIDILLLIKIYILLKNIDVLSILLNIDILAFHVILPYILDKCILSSHWKRRTYKILYFPRFGNEESIKFSYLSRIQTEATEQMVAGEGCCGEWVVSDVLGSRAGAS